MTDAAFADAIRIAFLVGVLMGVPFTMCVQEVARGFKEWRLHLRAERTRLTRCDRDDECVDERGHSGPCSIVEYD